MRNIDRRMIKGVMVAMLTLTTATAFGHGDKGHAKDKMSPHMKDMYALKEKVPQKYRIMERTPIMPTDQSLAQGKAAFNQFCAVCHGIGGRGDGAAAKGLPTQPAKFLDLKHSAVCGPGEEFWIIGNGSGATGMPPTHQT